MRRQLASFGCAACALSSHAWGAPYFARVCDYSVEFPADPAVKNAVAFNGTKTARAELVSGRYVLREECVAAKGAAVERLADLERQMRRFAERDGQISLSARTTKSNLGWTVTVRGTKLEAGTRIATEHRCTVGERSIACLTGMVPVMAGPTAEVLRFLNSIQKVDAAEDRIGNYRVPAWTKLGLGYYIDLDSSEQSADGRHQVLVLREFESREDDGALSDVVQYDVDCKGRTYRTLAELRYREPTAGGGKPIAVVTEESPWLDVQANSLPDEVFRAQCVDDHASAEAPLPPRRSGVQ
jgi:hypothetical protein